MIFLPTTENRRERQMELTIHSLLPSAYYPLLTTHCVLPSAYYPLLTTHCLLPTSKSEGVQISGWMKSKSDGVGWDGVGEMRVVGFGTSTPAASPPHPHPTPVCGIAYVFTYGIRLFGMQLFLGA